MTGTKSAKFIFTDRFDWTVPRGTDKHGKPEGPRVAMHFKADTKVSVTRVCGEAAIAAGKGNWEKAKDD